MTQDKTPQKPPRPEKVLRRETALRDNLLKRKQQQRARAQADTHTTPATKDDE